MRTIPLLGLLAAFLLVKLSGSPEILAKHTVVGNPLPGQSAAGGVFDITTILGEIIVFLFYWFKFNEWAGEGVAPKGFRPRPARHFTTWLRFLGWNTFYGLLMVGVYTVIVFFPEIISRVLDSFASASSALKTPVPAVSVADKLFDLLPRSEEMKIHDPISATKLVPYAVMITTVVWSGMRPFAEFERRFRLRLQERAAIPTEAKNLIETFESELDSFVPEKENIKEILNDRQGRLFKKEDFYDHGEHLWFLMARLQYLYHLLRKYNREPVFSRLAERYDDEFMELKTKMATIHELAAQRISDINEMLRDEGINQTTALSNIEKKALQEGVQPETLKSAEQLLAEQLEAATKFKEIYFQRQEKYLRSAIKNTSELVVQLIVCGVLAVGRSSQHCRDLLKAFGLQQQNRIPNQLDTVVVTWVTIGALFITFVCSLIFYYAEQSYGSGDSQIVPKNINDVFFWAVAAALMHLLATVGGYFCQRSLESARERLQIGNMRTRPLSVRVQVAEALWAASFGFSLNIFLLGALLALEGGIQGLTRIWWWAFVPAVTAFFAALYTQKVDRSEKQLNWLMLEQGLATGLVALAVFYLLYSENLSSVWMFGCYSTVTTIISGLALGSILQKWVEGLERPAGKVGLPDQRKEKRRHPLYARAKWLSDKGDELPVRVLNISSSGAALKTKKPLEIETEGVVKIIGKKEQRARVVRNDDNDAHRIYVEFQESAA